MNYIVNIGYLRIFSLAAALAFMLHTQPAHAVKNDENTLIDGAKLCTRYLPRHERQYGIPEHLLAAIASTESGRFHRGLGLNLPWPWTINVNGRGYFFDTKEEAVAAVNKLRSQGFKSIDVGCMQVNLHHHPNAFASVEQAFDPAYNIGYAANFLKNNFKESGSWRTATASYHSRTQYYGNPYANQVFNSWGRIVSKVADARAGRPVLNTNAGSTVASQKTGSFNVAHAVRPSYRSPHMHMVSVNTRDTRNTTKENGVIVIRPDSKADSTVYQQSDEAAKLVTKVANVKVTSTAGKKAVETEETSSTRESNGPIRVISLSEKVTSAKGQFSPRSKLASNAASEGVVKPQNKMFVFDN